MKFSKRNIERVIREFGDKLDWCYFQHYNPNQVVKFFGKERARNWCGEWNGYPDNKLIAWWEERYKTNWWFNENKADRERRSYIIGHNIAKKKGLI